MQFLVEKEFFIKESHVVIHDDSPVQGSSEFEVLISYTHGPFKTRKEVEAKTEELVKKYSTVKRVRTDNWSPAADIIKVADTIEYKTVLSRKTSFHVEGPEIEPNVERIYLVVEEKILEEKAV